MLGGSTYLRRVKITDLHFSGAISKDTLNKEVFKSLRATFNSSMARWRDLLEEKMTKSSA